MKYSTEPSEPVAFTRKHDRYYTAFAGFYEAAVRRLPLWKTWLRCALPHIEGPRVLEVSFGTGYLLGQYAGRVEAHGIDYNRTMVATTARALSSSGLASALAQANVEALPYRNETFDSVVNTMAFSGYPKGREALAEMVRVLCPQGKLVLIDINFPADGNRIRANLANLWKLSGDLIRDMGSLFGEAGLEFTDEEIGAGGSVHLYVARRRAWDS